MAVDAQGNVYIADTFNHRVRKVTPGGIISTFAGTGTQGFSGDGGPATAAQLDEPAGVTVDAQGNVYIAEYDGHRVREVTPAGIITTFAGNGVFGFSGDGGPATAAQLFSPVSVAVDAQGNVYIADQSTERIRLVENHQLVAQTGDNQTAPAGTAVSIPPAFRVEDGNGNPLAGVPVTFAVTTGGGSVTGASAISDASGNATVGSWALGTTAGVNTLTATTPFGSVTFTATAVPGAAAQLAFATQPSTVVPGQFISPALSVLVEDVFGNVVTTENSTVSLALGTNPTDATLNGTTRVSVVNGRATFTNLNLSTFGSGFTLVASAGNLPGLISQPFDVNHITITPSTNVVLVGQPVTFYIKVFALAPFEGNPFGTVTLSVGNTVLGTVPVDATGQATFTTSALPLAPGATVTPNVVTALYNDPITATTTVTTVAATGAGVPVTVVLGLGASGTDATLLDGAPAGTLAGTLQTNVPLSGQFAPATDTLVPGFGDDDLFTLVSASATVYNLVADFDAHFAFRRSYTIMMQTDTHLPGGVITQVFTLFVAPPVDSAPARTSTTLTTGGGNDQPFRLTATISGNGGVPTGLVLFVADGTPLGSLTLAHGTATFTTTALSAGSHDVEAVYVGDGTFAGSTSAILSITAGQASTHAPGTLGMFDSSGFNPFGTAWYLRSANSPGSADAGAGFVFGGVGWHGLIGDWNGDGLDTVGVVDPFDNPFGAVWALRNENSAGAPDITPFVYGLNGWTPLVGDWTGTGHSGIGMFDPTTGNLYLRNGPDTGAPDAAFQVGLPGMIPFAGDFFGFGHSGVGVVDPGLYTPGVVTWYLKEVDSSGNLASVSFVYGAPGFKPVVGDWNGDGIVTIGVIDGGGNWYLRNSNSAGAPDLDPIPFGLPFWTPVSGRYPRPAQSLRAAGPSPAGDTGPALDAGSLQQVVTAALQRLEAAGVGSDVLHRLAAGPYEVGAVPAGDMAVARADRVVFSPDAAGHGWFVDPTPLADEEFGVAAPGSPLLALPGSPAAGREDLLTVVLHEMGHRAGRADHDGAGDSGDLMTGLLSAGTRRIDVLDAVFASR